MVQPKYVSEVKACVFVVEGGRSGGDRAGRTEAVITVPSQLNSNDDRCDHYFEMLFVMGSDATRAMSR